MAIDKWDRLEVAATNTFGSSTTLVISSFHLVELGIIIIFIIIRHWVGDRWHRLDGTGSMAQARWHRLEGTGSMAQARRHRHDAQARWHRLKGTGLMHRPDGTGSKAQARWHRLKGTGSMAQARRHRHKGTGSMAQARCTGTMTRAQAWVHISNRTTQLKSFIYIGVSASTEWQDVLREWHTSWTSHNRQDRCLV
jgi:hypothetical protein